MFDARKAKLLPAGEHITFADHPGLRLKSSRTNKSWIYRYKSPVDGRMRQIKIGEWPTVSFPRAVTSWEDLRTRRDAGEDPAAAARSARVAAKEQIAAAKRDAKVAAYTVAMLCDDYWHGHIKSHRAQKGATEIQRLFDKELGAVGAMPVQSVTRAIAFDLIKGLAERKPVIAGQLRRELGAAWEYAVDGGRISDETPNWWRQILKGKIRSKGKTISGEHIGTAKRVLSENEIGDLIQWLPNMSQLLQDTLTLYLWTACRGAEIVQAEGREIIKEATGWWWVIPKEKTKNRHRDGATDHRVPLFGRAKTVLLRRKERYGDGHLFPPRTGKAKHIEQKTIQSTLFCYQPYSEVRPKQYPIRLPVTHWAPHDLRRTSRTLLASMGCPDSVAEAILGHAQPGVLGIYNRHAYDAERLHWMALLSKKLERFAT